MCMLHFVYNKTVIHYLRAFYHQCSHTKTILGLTLQSLVHIQDLSFTNNGSNVKRYQMFKKQVQLKEHQDQDDECLTPLFNNISVGQFCLWRNPSYLEKKDLPIHFSPKSRPYYLAHVYLFIPIKIEEVTLTTTTLQAAVVMIVWQLDFQLHVQLVPITTKVVSSNPAQVRCTRYNIM